MKKLALCGAVVAAMAVAAPAAMAFEGGDIVIRGGMTNVDPDSGTGDVFVGGADSGLDASVDDDTQLGLNFVYFYNEHWAVELLAATPFKHDVGLSNGEQFAEVKQLPPTLMALYYFNDNSYSFQPYAGVGINYTTFFEEDLSDYAVNSLSASELSVDDSWGWSAQVGMDYMINDKLMINASVRYIDIDTTANFKLGATDSHVDLEIDPIVTSLMIGYKF